jgi:hypothetical protein
MLENLNKTAFVTLLTLALSFSTTVWASEYKIVPNTTKDDRKPLAGGSVSIHRTFRVTSDGGGPMSTLDVTLVHDEKAGLVWWTAQRGDSVTPMPPLLVERAQDGKSLVGWYQLRGGLLMVAVSKNSAKSISDAEAVVLDRLSRPTPEYGSEAQRIDMKEALGPQLIAEFFYGGSAGTDRPARLLKAVPTKDGWELELEAADSRRAVLSLSPEFRVRGFALGQVVPAIRPDPPGGRE